MNRKNRPWFYIGTGFVAFLTMLPAIPRIASLLVCLAIVVTYGFFNLKNFLAKFYKKIFFNEYLYAFLATILLFVSGRYTHAALTIIIFDVVMFYYKELLAKANAKIEFHSCVTPKECYIKVPSGKKKVLAKDILPGQTVLLSEGDIIPCDGVVSRGGAMIDYTNLFGPSELSEAYFRSKCFAGGVLQSGSIELDCLKQAKDSVVAKVKEKVSKAHKKSLYRKKTENIANLFSRFAFLLGIVVFAIVFFMTKDFPKSANMCAVIWTMAIIAPQIEIIAMLYHAGIRYMVTKGGIVSREADLVRAEEITSVLSNVMMSDETAMRLEDAGIAVTNKKTTSDCAVICQSENEVENQSTTRFKFALGFLSNKAEISVLDGNIERIVSILRYARMFKNTVLFTTCLFLVGKLLLLLLTFTINIVPTAALLLEFLVWVIGILYSSKYNVD